MDIGTFIVLILQTVGGFYLSLLKVFVVLALLFLLVAALTALVRQRSITDPSLFWCKYNAYLHLCGLGIASYC